VALHTALNAQGDKIRDLKTSKADKAAITAEVETLKKLKVPPYPLGGKDSGTHALVQAEFKAATGQDYNRDAPPASGGAAATSAPVAAQGTLSEAFILAFKPFTCHLWHRRC
jgi:hypothetical protein